MSRSFSTTIEIVTSLPKDLLPDFPVRGANSERHEEKNGV